MAIFENHEHVFKKTYPLKNGKKNTSSGVYYIGNGGWGTGKRNCDFVDKPEEFELVDNVVGHYWVVRFDPSNE